MIWDINHLSLLTKSKIHSNAATSICISQKSFTPVIYTVGLDKTLKLFDVKSNRVEKTIQIGKKKKIISQSEEYLLLLPLFAL